MGKSLLVAIGLALTLSSLIPVDSSDKIIVSRYLTRISFGSNNFSNCHFKAHQITYDYIKIETLRSIVDLIGKAFIFIYCCLAIGALCDQHFVPNLGSLGKSLFLSPEITGSILIPLGTSGPEIFSSAIGIFFTDNDIGTGAVIGSSCYNQLAIPAACGLTVAYFIGKPIKLEAEPILRDLMFYTVSVIGLIFTVKDNSVDIYDALLLLLLFALYFGIKIGQNSDERANTDDNNNDVNQIQYKEVETEEDERDDGEDLMNNKYINILLKPLTIMFDITMPSKFSPVIKFFISIAWLSTLSFFSVNAITDISEALSIPHAIAGMTILAAGSAVPDLVTSVVVIRKSGTATMGICSAISANIFAILVGLGFPWFIKCAINGYSTSSPSFILYSESLPFTCFMLLMAIFAFMFSLKIAKWQLFNKLAIICGSIHLTFFVSTIVIEYLV